MGATCCDKGRNDRLGIEASEVDGPTARVVGCACSNPDVPISSHAPQSVCRPWLPILRPLCAWKTPPHAGAALVGLGQQLDAMMRASVTAGYDTVGAPSKRLLSVAPSAKLLREARASPPPGLINPGAVLMRPRCIPFLGERFQ